MKKTYEIEVDCANCAQLMEQAASKVWFLVNFNIVNDVVAKVVVNFMTQKMIIEFTEGADIKAVMKTVLKECKKVEPDCEIDL